MSATAQAARPEGHPMTRTLTVTTLAVAVLALVAFPALAQDYPPEPEVAVGTPNAVVTIRGSDWGAGTEVVVEYRNTAGQTTAATAVVEEDGTFAADLPLPPDAEPGVTEVAVRGTGADGQPREWQPRILVQADDAEAGDAGAVDGVAAGDAAQPDEVEAATALPRTGAGSLLLLAAVAGLIGTGTAALWVARRRNRA